MNELLRHSDQIKKVCSSYKVKSLFAFGSITSNELHHDSDIDLMVEIDDRATLSYSDNYFNLKFELEKILKRQIYLLESKAVKNPYLKKE